jgi:hypothetical protein
MTRLSKRIEADDNIMERVDGSSERVGRALGDAAADLGRLLMTVGGADN